MQPTQEPSKFCCRKVLQIRMGERKVVATALPPWFRKAKMEVTIQMTQGLLRRQTKQTGGRFLQVAHPVRLKGG